jgi:hypothetical protein
LRNNSRFCVVLKGHDLSRAAKPLKNENGL